MRIPPRCVHHLAVLLLPALFVAPAEAHVYGDVAFLSNFDETESLSMTYAGHAVTVQNLSVVILNTSTGEILVNTSNVNDVTPPDPTSRRSQAKSGFSWYQEKAGSGVQPGKSIHSGFPEQLAITDNDSDYLWYTTVTTIGPTSKVSIETEGGAIAYAYVDGKPLSALHTDREGTSMFQGVPHLKGPQEATLQVGLGDRNTVIMQRNHVIRPSVVHAVTRLFTRACVLIPHWSHPLTTPASSRF